MKRPAWMLGFAFSIASNTAMAREPDPAHQEGRIELQALLPDLECTEGPVPATLDEDLDGPLFGVITLHPAGRCALVFRADNGLIAHNPDPLDSDRDGVANACQGLGVEDVLCSAGRRRPSGSSVETLGGRRSELLGSLEDAGLELAAFVGDTFTRFLRCGVVSARCARRSQSRTVPSPLPQGRFTLTTRATMPSL